MEFENLDTLEARRQMERLHQEARDEQRGRELDQLEQDARMAGRTAKKRHLMESQAFSEQRLLLGSELIAFATGLAQMYLQKDLQRLEAHEIVERSLLYLSFFRDGYAEVQQG